MERDYIIYSRILILSKREKTRNVHTTSNSSYIWVMKNV